MGGRPAAQGVDVGRRRVPGVNAAVDAATPRRVPVIRAQRAAAIQPGLGVLQEAAGPERVAPVAAQPTTAPPGRAQQTAAAPSGAVAQVGPNGRATRAAVRQVRPVQAQVPKVGEPVGVGPRPPLGALLAAPGQGEWPFGVLHGRVRPRGRPDCTSRRWTVTS